MGAMAALLDRTRTPAPGSDTDGPRPLALTAGLAVCWSAGVGLALCIGVAMVGWFIGSTGSPGDAVRVGADAWLLGLGSGLRADAVTIGAVPLGLTAGSGLLLWRSAVWAAAAARVADARSATAGTAIVTAGFATVATLCAVLAGTAAVGVSPGRAFLCALLLAALTAGPGMVVGAGLHEQVLAMLPRDARAALRGGAAAVMAMLGVGALLVTAGLVADFGQAANVADAMDTGVVGGAIFTLVGLLLLPNASLLAASYVLGPGFSFGADTVVAPSGVTLGPVPAFPLLSALPDEGSAPWWATGLLAVPVLVGLLAAVVALRHHPVLRFDRAALRGALTGLVGGVATGALTGLAGGSVGPGRMAETGADVLACVGAGSLSMALGGLLGGMVVCWRLRRAR